MDFKITSAKSNMPIWKKTQQQMDKIFKITKLQYTTECPVRTQDEILKMYNHVTDMSNLILVLSPQCTCGWFVDTVVSSEKGIKRNKSLDKLKGCYQNYNIKGNIMYLINLNSKDKKGIYQNVVKFEHRSVK